MPRLRAERALPYSVEQIFDLVADVEQYPDFLPWWAAARVTSRSAGSYRTDQVLRFGVIRERFRSTTTLDRPRHIEVTSGDPPFRLLRLAWRFEPAARQGCQVVLETEVALRSRLRQRVFDLALAGAPAAIIDAFERRARALYGDPAQAP